MFEHLLESTRGAAISTRLAAVSLARHASALILAVTLTGPASRSTPLIVHRADPMAYVVQAASPVSPWAGEAVGPFPPRGRRQVNLSALSAVGLV